MWTGNQEVVVQPCFRWNMYSSKCRNAGKILRDIKYLLPWMFANWVYWYMTPTELCRSFELEIHNKIPTLTLYPTCNYMHICVPSFLSIFSTIKISQKKFKEALGREDYYHQTKTAIRNKHLAEYRALITHLSLAKKAIFS